MSYSIIPLTSDPNQKFSITLPVNGGFTTLRFFVRWNDAASYWVMDLSTAKGEALVIGIPLLVSDAPAANLLSAYDYLSIGSACLVTTTNKAGEQPSDANLGTDYQLIWGDNIATA